MDVRDAVEADVEAITAIYNHAVADTTAIWNDTLVDAANRTAWLADHHRHGQPVLVAVSGTGDVLGYATYGSFRAFEGYRHTVEHSVYVRADQQGRGIGSVLMGELVERARQAGVHVMVAAIEAGNVGSIRLHEKLGFTSAGVLHQVGRKYGRWLDLALLELVLDTDDDAPMGPGR